MKQAYLKYKEGVPASDFHFEKLSMFSPDVEEFSVSNGNFRLSLRAIGDPLTEEEMAVKLASLGRNLSEGGYLFIYNKENRGGLENVS